jgi:hypothetical protein
LSRRIGKRSIGKSRRITSSLSLVSTNGLEII